jgi:histidine triad (HIT) family protein
MSGKASNEAGCVFCTRISRGEYDKDQPGFSFEPLNPVVPGHRLFVSPRHLVDASQKPEDAAKVFTAAAEYARRQGDDFNLITSGGVDATQTVFHLHIHYVPRDEGDGLTLPWTGQVASRG